MGKVELMQAKLEKQRQLPKEIKDKLNNITFINLLISIALMIYIIVVNLLYMNENLDIFINSAKASAFTFAIFDIVLFEIAYRKESVALTVHGIELLCVSLFVLAIPYIYIYTDPIIRSIIMTSPVYFSIYYVGKALIIHIIETNKYIDNLSDVLEILQDDIENKSYIEDIEIEEESQSVEVSEKEIISGVREIQQQMDEEKEKIKAAKKEAKKKENKND